MKTRPLGNSDMNITPIGFGAWAIGGSGWQYAWGKQDDKESIAAIHRALECGINWIDTAAVYGTGHSEEVVAEALKAYKGPRPYVFTKGGLRWDDKGQVRRDITPESIRKECEDSLRRLRVETIDLYQIHWPSESLEEIGAAWHALCELRQQGKARWIGVSNFNAEQMEHCRQSSPLTSLQPPYSLLHREVETSPLPYCLKNNIGVIVYSPMASGLLTGAMTKERAKNLAPDDWRSKHPDFSEPNLSRHLALVERLRKVGARHGRTPGEIAIAWTLSHAAVTGAIVGLRTSKQVDGVIGAAEVHLTEAEKTEVENPAS